MKSVSDRPAIFQQDGSKYQALGGEVSNFFSFDNLYMWFSTFNPRIHVTQLSQSSGDIQIGEKNILITQANISEYNDSQPPPLHYLLSSPGPWSLAVTRCGTWCTRPRKEMGQSYRTEDAGESWKDDFHRKKSWSYFQEKDLEEPGWILRERETKTGGAPFRLGELQGEKCLKRISSKFCNLCKANFSFCCLLWRIQDLKLQGLVSMFLLMKQIIERIKTQILRDPPPTLGG